jgi:hypothetical protein
MANPNQSRYLQAPRKGYDSNGRRLSDGAKKITGVRSAGSKYADLAGEMEDAGVKIKGGQITPTEKFGTMAGLASEQRNPLSRGSRAGSISTLGQPMNSMYAANPDFFRSQIAQRNAPATAESVGAQRTSIQTPTAEVKAANVPSPTGSFETSLVEKRGFPGGRTSPTFGSQGLPDDTPGSASSAARGMAFKGATTGAPSGAPVAPAAPSQMDLNRQALEQGAAGIRLRREVLGQLPTVRATSVTGAPMPISSGSPMPGESRTIEGKYGKGSARLPISREKLINLPLRRKLLLLMTSANNAQP